MTVQEIHSDLEMRTFGKIFRAFQEIGNQQARYRQTDIHAQLVGID